MHVVLVCEIFLFDENANKFPIPVYNVVHASQTNLSRCGVAIYLLDDFNYRERPDLCINIEGHFESITVEIDAKQGRHNLIISEIYRVPNTNVRSSIERYDEMVTGFGRTKCDIIIGSDLNFNKVNTNRNSKK